MSQPDPWAFLDKGPMLVIGTLQVVYRDHVDAARAEVTRQHAEEVERLKAEHDALNNTALVVLAQVAAERDALRDQLAAAQGALARCQQTYTAQISQLAAKDRELATKEQKIREEVAISNRLRVSWNEDVGHWRDRAEAAEARLATATQELDRLVDLPLCRKQVGNAGVPGNTEEALQMWHDYAQSLWAENAALRDNNKAVKELFDARAARLATLEAERDALKGKP